jgi:hypothetical protein
VTDTGFYYDAQGAIELEDDALLAALPKTKVYADRPCSPRRASCASCGSPR